MPATRAVLSAWFDVGVEQGKTHMVVRCDSFDFRGGESDGCCYRIYCDSGEQARKAASGGGDRLMEVYNLRKPKDPQFAVGRVFDYDDVPYESDVREAR
jgi:hypothetical protein